MNTWYGSVLLVAALISAGCGAPASNATPEVPLAAQGSQQSTTQQPAAQQPAAQQKMVAPDIQGTISQPVITDRSARPTARVMVEETPGEQTGDKAMVTIPFETPVYVGSEGVRGSVTDLKQGQKLMVWYNGPVALSYPAQATARAVMIVNQ